MKPSITPGRLFGIVIGVHYGWFVIALLITLSLVGEAREQIHDDGQVWTGAPTR